MKDQFIQMSDQLAYQFFQNKVYDLAYKQSEITLAMDPLNKKIRFNTAKCAYYTSLYEKAIEYMNICLMLDTEWEDAKRELALYLPWVNKKKEAFEILQTLPKDNRTIFNLGWYNLSDGNFLKGMECLEHGRNIGCWGTKNIQFPTPEWNGESIEGKKLFIITEGGIGDEIIFARFFRQLKQMGAEIFVKCTETTKLIFNRMDEVSFVTTKDMYPIHDYWVASMSLPVKLKLNKVTGESFIKPSAKYVEKWKSKLDLGDFNIGLRWEGGQLFEHDQRRTLPVKKLSSRLKGKLFSLQKETVKTKTPSNVQDLELETLEDTLAVISLMDIVITSCTCIAHLAGAIGKKTYVIVPIVPYFIWSGDGNKSDWYDSIEIFRQKDSLNWDEPIEECINNINNR